MFAAYPALGQPNSAKLQLGCFNKQSLQSKNERLVKHGKNSVRRDPMNKSTQLRCRTISGIIHKHLTVALQNSQPLPHPKPEHYVHNRTEVDNITWKLVSFLSAYAVYSLHVNFLLSSTVELVLGVSFGFISGSKLQACMKSMSWRARGSPRGKTSHILVSPADVVESDNHRRYHGGYSKADALTWLNIIYKH